MKTTYQRAFKIMLLGLTGAGKSRLGNKLTQRKIFKESEGPKSCTKQVQKAFAIIENVEIIDTQGFLDTEGDDKDCLIGLSKAINENTPNLFAFVQKANDKRFGEGVKSVIKKICQMFKTKSIWDNFIIIFTCASTISEKNREKVARNFYEQIIDVLMDYYGNNDVKDNLPIPKKFKYYFVELFDDDEQQLDTKTKEKLSEIISLTKEKLPISDTGKRFIIERKIIETNCEESIKKYNRLIEGGAFDKMKQLGARFVSTDIGGLFTAEIGGTAGAIGAAAVGLTALPGLAVGAAAFIGSGLLIKNVTDKLEDGHNYSMVVDENSEFEDYKTYDKELLTYNDGTTEIVKINIKEHTRLSPKKK